MSSKTTNVLLILRRTKLDGGYDWKQTGLLCQNQTTSVQTSTMMCWCFANGGHERRSLCHLANYLIREDLLSLLEQHDWAALCSVRDTELFLLSPVCEHWVLTGSDKSITSRHVFKIHPLISRTEIWLSSGGTAGEQFALCGEYGNFLLEWKYQRAPITHDALFSQPLSWARWRVLKIQTECGRLNCTPCSFYIKLIFFQNFISNQPAETFTFSVLLCPAAIQTGSER